MKSTLTSSSQSSPSIMSTLEFVLCQIDELCYAAGARAVLTLVCVCSSLRRHLSDEKRDWFWRRLSLQTFPNLTVGSYCEAESTILHDIDQENHLGKLYGVSTAAMLYYSTHLYQCIDEKRADWKLCITYGMADESFTSEKTRLECASDDTVARQTLRSLQLLYPLCIPPREYFFASHFTLRRLCFALFRLQLSFSPVMKPQMLCRLLADHSISLGYCLRPLLSMVLRYTTRDECLRVLKAGTNASEFTVTGLGPVDPMEPTDGGRPVSAEGLVIQTEYTLHGKPVDLCVLARYIHAFSIRLGPIRQFDDERQRIDDYIQALRPLYQRVVRAALRYDRTDKLRPGDFLALEKDNEPLVLSPLNAGEAEWDTLRHRDWEKYDQWDPRVTQAIDGDDLETCDWVASRVGPAPFSSSSSSSSSNKVPWREMTRRFCALCLEGT